MVGTLGSSAGEVLLHLASEIIWTSPPTTPHTPSQDKLLDGVVEIECPGVQIQLRGTQMVGMPIGVASLSLSQRTQLRWEEHIVLDRTLRYQASGKDGHSVREHASRPRSFKELVREKTGVDASSDAESNGLFLERGFHDFEFHFIFPAWAAPYERCKYGRTRYLIIATALGAGRGGSNITVQREVFVVQQHALDAGPLPMEMHYHNTHEALGLISIGITSASLTVGGIATLTIMHPNPPPNVNVHLVRVYIEQTYELYNHETNSWMRTPLDKLRVWEVGSLPRLGTGSLAKMSPALWAQGVLSAVGVHPHTRLGSSAAQAHPTVQPLDASLHVDERPIAHVAEAGKHGYRIKTVVRLPDDNRLRPTTARGTRTDIRITHEMGVEMLFSRTDVLDERPDSDFYGQPKVQVFSMTKPVTIPSCVFTYDAIHLPPYSQESPVSHPTTPHQKRPESFTPRSTLNGHGGALSTERDWNRFIHSLTNSLASSTIRSHGSSRNTSREPSPTRLGFRSRPASWSSSRASSRASSRPPSPPPEANGASTPVIPVLRPNDMSARARVSSLATSDRSAPRNLPAGTPWAVSHLPPRLGESHNMCNCGQPTERLVEAEERFLEGAPTAPGAWVDSVPLGAHVPPWTPSSRPTSPTQEWLSSYLHTPSPFSEIDKHMPFDRSMEHDTR